MTSISNFVLVRKGSGSVALLFTLVLLSAGSSSGTRSVLETPDTGNSSSSSNNSRSASIPVVPDEKLDLGLNDTAKMVARRFGDALKTMEEKNITIKDLMPKNISIPTFKEVVNFTLSRLKDANLASGMTTMQVLKAFMTGTISSNTADTNTPDKGLSDVQSGALNVRPFVDGAAMSNALTLAGRDATANSRGIVFGLVGTGRASNDATALGLTGAKSSTDTFVINGGGLNQNAMGSNLAITPQGPSDTSIRSAAFNIIGGTYTGGLTNSLGKKGADSAGLGAGMTGLGDSFGTQFSNSIAQGTTSSNTGVIAGTLTGQAKGTVGSVATSAKRSADTQALATSKAGLGSSTSKAASLSTAAQNATSRVGSDSFSGVGNSASISSTTSQGMNAESKANSIAKSEIGAANAVSMSKSVGITSASASSNSTSKPSRTGVRHTPVLLTHLKLPSTTFSSSKSRSSTFRGTKDKKLPSFLPPLPAFMTHPGSHGPDATLPLLGEALISNLGLKALLPATPKIIPQLPTLNQTVTVDAAPACNETELNANRTADQEWKTCNATANATSPAPDPTANLPGLKFFDNLKKMNDDFTKENIKTSPSPSPSPGSKSPKPPSSSAKKPGSNSKGADKADHKDSAGQHKGGGGGDAKGRSGDNQQQGSHSSSSPKPGPFPGKAKSAWASAQPKS